MTHHATNSIATRPLGLILIGTLLPGCTTGGTTWPERSTLTQAQWERLAEIADQQAMSAAASQSAFTGATWHLGELSAVNSIVPVLSPDGTHIAVCSGDEPSLAARLGLADTSVSAATGVAIWDILPGRGGLKLQIELQGPLLLTDSADETGFLVERPNDDGSRWIGKVDWITGDIRWLVAGDGVATFPAIGQDGQLAWSERPLDGEDFDLVIRFPQDGSAATRETVIPHGDGDWLLPSWSRRSSRLSVYRVTPTGLELFSFDADSPDTLQQELRRISVLAGGRRVDALLAASGRSHVVGLPNPPLEEVFYYNPRLQRMMLWLPMGLHWDQPMQLADLSVAAVHDDQGGFLLTMPDGLYWQDRNDHRKLMRIDLTAWIVRPTNNPMRPFLLMRVGDGRISIEAMRPDRSRAAQASPAPAG